MKEKTILDLIKEILGDKEKMKIVFVIIAILALFSLIFLQILPFLIFLILAIFAYLKLINKLK